MLCPQCRRHNPNNEGACQFCGSDLQGPRHAGPEGIAWDEEPSAPPRTSGMAIAALVLGVLGVFTLGTTAAVGLILGIVALAQIRGSRGHLKGDLLAIIGIIVSVIAVVYVSVVMAILLPRFGRAGSARAWPRARAT